MCTKFPQHVRVVKRTGHVKYCTTSQPTRLLRGGLKLLVGNDRFRKEMNSPPLSRRVDSSSCCQGTTTGPNVGMMAREEDARVHHRVPPNM